MEVAVEKAGRVRTARFFPSPLGGVAGERAPAKPAVTAREILGGKAGGGFDFLVTGVMAQLDAGEKGLTLGLSVFSRSGLVPVLVILLAMQDWLSSALKRALGKEESRPSPGMIKCLCFIVTEFYSRKVERESCDIFQY